MIKSKKKNFYRQRDISFDHFLSMYFASNNRRVHMMVFNLSNYILNAIKIYIF